MSLIPRLPKDAPPVTITAPEVAVDIVATTPASPRGDGRHDSVSSSVANDDKISEEDKWTLGNKLESLVDDSTTSLSRSHIFQDEKVAEHWRKVYDSTKYENRHRFDPAFEWTAEEEKALLRKVDLKVLIWSWVMFMSLDLIRKNINRVLPDNFLVDLRMNQNDFNNGQVIYLMSFLTAELPSGLISKKIGADRWVPTQMVAWGIVSAFQAMLTNRAGFFVTRALVGVLEGGFLPDVILYLSYWYTGEELNTRLSYFYTVLGVSQIFGSLLAAGLIELGKYHHLHGWQYVFIVEGALSVIVGFISYFLLAAGPTQTKGFFSKNGWFTEHEEKILVNRVLRDDPTKGDMNNREGVTLRNLLRSLGERDLWPIYVLGCKFDADIGYVTMCPQCNERIL